MAELKKMKQLLRIAFILFPCLLFAGCSSSETENKSIITQNTYEQITQDEAKSIMDGDKPYTLLDVRTKEEFDSEHIKGAILIPDYEINTRAEDILTDKNALILVYCRTGRRSKNAANNLATLGYTNVKEFGGINDWKYGTVTE